MGNARARTLRSASKSSEKNIAAKKVKKLATPNTFARTLRSASKSSENNIAAKKVKKLEKLAPTPRVTRSSNKNSHVTVQQVAPAIVPTIKIIVKRADFVKLNNFAADQIVLAKQKYSIPWPIFGRILKVEKEKVLVYFFGDKRTGFVQSNEIYDFAKSFQALKETILSKKKPASFITGVQEVEVLLQINGQNSVLSNL